MRTLLLSISAYAILGSCLYAQTASVLADRLRRIAAASGGELGVAIQHLESGATASHNPEMRFPMASTFKAPLALVVLDRVDRGLLKLEQPIRIELQDVRPWASPLAVEFPKGGAAVPLLRLLMGMVMDSDNTAADTLLRRIGGPRVVTDWLSSHSFHSMRVDRNEAEMALDSYGINPRLLSSSWSPALFSRLFAQVSAEQHRRGLYEFVRDERDTTTPEDMTRLLAAVYSRKLVSPKSTSLLLDWMRRTATGPNRLRGLLPAGTVVEHRTGTGGSLGGFCTATNDVGVITLPNHAGHLVVSVYLKAATAPADARELTIATVARAAYDNWIP